MVWDISKDFHLEYGHRVWSQQLDKSLCARDDYACACRHLHGHSGKVTLHLAGDTLERGMVTDFKHTGFLKDFIDDHLDHKFIIDKDDPGFGDIVSYDYDYLEEQGYLADIEVAGVVVGKTINMKPFGCEPCTIELLESFFIVDFIPTSENLARFIFNTAELKLKHLVAGVDWQETAKSIARYKRRGY